MKKFLILFFLMLSIPICAGELDKASVKGNGVLFYFYSPDCFSCKKFDSRYYEIQKLHKDVEYVRINVDTPEGVKLFRKYHGLYIPYLVLIGSKTKKAVSLSLSCAVDEMCLDRFMSGTKSKL